MFLGGSKNDLIFMADQYTTSSAIIPILLQLLVDKGMPREKIEKVTGIDPGFLNDPDSRILVNQFIKLWQVAIKTSGDPALALKLRNHLPQDHMHFALRIAYYSNNLLNALQNWAKYTSLITDCNEVEWHQDRKHIIVTYTIVSPEHQNRWFPEYDLSLAIRFARYFSNKDFRPVEACFQYPDPGYREEYCKIFQSPIRFDQEKTKIVCKKSDLTHKIIFHDPYMKSVMGKFADMTLEKVSKLENIEDTVREFIIKNLPKGSMNIEMAAADMGMERSTLHRKLKQQNTTFTKLLEEMRQDLAKKYLRLDFSNKEITYLLGFTEPSTFQHAFKRWFGQNPGEFRRQTS